MVLERKHYLEAGNVGENVFYKENILSYTKYSCKIQAMVAINLNLNDTRNKLHFKLFKYVSGKFRLKSLFYKKKFPFELLNTYTNFCVLEFYTVHTKCKMVLLPCIKLLLFSSFHAIWFRRLCVFATNLSILFYFIIQLFSPINHCLGKVIVFKI